MKKALFVVAALLTGTSAIAQEIVVGAGYTKYGNILAEDSAIFDIEYHHSPFQDTRHWDVSWGGVLSSTANGDVFVGAGLVGVYDFDSPWFAELSVMPGAYWESDPLTDLGQTFEIRSLLGVGYTFANGNALSLAVSHKSNGGLANSNPGVNALHLRYHARF